MRQVSLQYVVFCGHASCTNERNVGRTHGIRTAVRQCDAFDGLSNQLNAGRFVSIARIYAVSLQYEVFYVSARLANERNAVGTPRIRRAFRLCARARETEVVPV